MASPHHLVSSFVVGREVAKVLGLQGTHRIEIHIPLEDRVEIRCTYLLTMEDALKLFPFLASAFGGTPEAQSEDVPRRKDAEHASD